MRERSKFSGSILGGAIGDALGYPVEFLSSKQILEQTSQKGVTDLLLRGGVAEISDDTQMTLFTAVGLLCGTAQIMRGSGSAPEEYVWQAYRDWYRTQTEPFSPSPEGSKTSWLLDIPALYSRRAPGNTLAFPLFAGKSPGRSSGRSITARGAEV